VPYKELNKESYVRNIKNIFKNVGLLVAAFAVMFSVTGLAAHAAPSVTISSPTNAAKLANGGTIPVSGTAPANTRVKLLLDGAKVATVTADGSGAWSSNLTNVAKGSHTLKAVNAEPGLHYFATAGAPSQLHSIDPLTGAVDTKTGFPIDLNGLTPLAVPSPDGKYVYASGFFFSQSNLQKVDLDTGTVEQVANYPSSVVVNVGAFSSDSTKYYAPNSDGTITIIDVASNTIIQTLNTGAPEHNSANAIDDKIYASDSTTGQVFVISQIDDSFSSFTPACPSSGKAVTVTPDFDDPNVIWAGCDNGYVIKLDKTTRAVLLTATVPGNVAGTLSIPGINKIVVSNTNAPEAFIVDSNTGALLETIALPAESFAPMPSSDGSKILIPTPGGSFANAEAVIINTDDYSLTNITLDGPTLAMFAGPDTVAEATTQFSIGETLASTGENIRNISLTAGAVAMLSMSVLVHQKRKFSK
jgi:hypothetical protein